MSSSMVFVDHHTRIFEREAEFEIDGSTTVLDIWLTEGGDLEVENIDRPEGRLKDGVYEEITGTTEHGETIVARSVLCDPLIGVCSMRSIEIIDEDWSVQDGEVEVIADILGFQCSKKPEHCRPDTQVNLLERAGFPAGGGNITNWSMVFNPFESYADRVNSIREYSNLVRTGQVELTVEGIYGNCNRVAEFASDRISEFTWLTAYIQGTLPAAPLLTMYDLQEVDSEGQISPVYFKANSVHSNIGSSCSRSNLLFRTHHEIPLYLDRAYELFVEKVDDLNLREVLGLYIDSLNSRRPVDPRFVNLCVAVEMLANQYTPDQGCTKKQIQLLVKELGVEFKDLIHVNGSFPTEYHPDLYHKHQAQLLEHRYIDSTLNSKILQNSLPAPQEKVLEYFWYPARNKVIHGSSNISVKDISTDHEALLVLLKRLLREILLEGNTEGLHGIQKFSPNELTGF